MKLLCHTLMVLLPTAIPPARADDFSARCADRAAIERVYHTHRLGTKPPFAQAMPPALIQQVVRQDQHKEAVLKKVYHVEITPAMVAAEVERINTTTRAPEVLAEIKHALGDDGARFASAMARPMVVERELRGRFDGDDKLHAAQRREAEQARADLLAGKPVKDLHEVTWQLTPRPAEDQPAPSAASPTTPTTPTQVKAKSRAYTNEATAQVAQTLRPQTLRPETLRPQGNSAPGKDAVYLEDLEPGLQKALREQLRAPGDVSPVVEMPGGFVVFLTKEKTAESLTAASFTVSKRSYEAWLGR